MSKRAGNNLRSALNVGDITNRARVFRDAVGGRERSDFYSFRLNRSSNFSLRLDRLRANANVRLMNGQGKMMMQSARPKRQPEAINTVLGAGTYYIRVFPARRSDQTRYRLRLSASELPQTPPPETPPGEPINGGGNEGGKKINFGRSGSSISNAESPPIRETGRDIIGTIGSETLRGGAGNDVIAGINGFDLLIGGGGANRFLLGDGVTPYYLGPGYAIITDFNAAKGDRIELTNNAFYPLSGYRLVHSRFFVPDAFGQYRDVGTAALDTAIYWQNDLLAIVQDAIVT